MTARHAEPARTAAEHLSKDCDAVGAGATIKWGDAPHSIATVSAADGISGSVIEKGDTTADQAATANAGVDDGTVSDDGDNEAPAAVFGQSTVMRGTAHPTGRDRHEKGGGVVDGVGVLEAVFVDDSVGSEVSVDAGVNVKLDCDDNDADDDCITLKLAYTDSVGSEESVDAADAEDDRNTLKLAHTDGSDEADGKVEAVGLGVGLSNIGAPLEHSKPFGQGMQIKDRITFPASSPMITIPSALMAIPWGTLNDDEVP